MSKNMKKFSRNLGLMIVLSMFAGIVTTAVAEPEISTASTSLAESASLTAEANIVANSQVRVFGTGQPGEKLTVIANPTSYYVPRTYSVEVGGDGAWGVMFPWQSSYMTGTFKVERSDGTAVVAALPTRGLTVNEVYVPQNGQAIYSGTGTPGDSIFLSLWYSDIVPPTTPVYWAYVDENGAWSVLAPAPATSVVTTVYVTNKSETQAARMVYNP